MTRPTSSAKPVFTKLGHKADARSIVLCAPSGFKVPANVAKEARVIGRFDLVLIFATSMGDLAKRLPQLQRALMPSGKLWVAWQKGGVTELSRDNIHALGSEFGLDGVATCAIDERWSALKLMWPKEQRGKG